MKYIAFILCLVSLQAQSACFQDANFNVTCIDTSSSLVDFRDNTNSPKLIEGNKYRGNINNNQFDPDSISNLYGKYGNPLSQDSVLNPFRNR